MSTELVELQDGILVEVQSDPDAPPRPCSAGVAGQVDGAMDSARDLLLKVVKPVAAAWDELSRDLQIEQVVIDLGLSFEASGKLFLVQGSAKANLTFKLTVRQKPKP